MVNQEIIRSELEGLERKILMLLNNRKALQKEIIRIKDENNCLKEELKHKKKAVIDLKQSMQVSALAQRIEQDSSHKEALTKTVDAYIAEIDRCIARLNI